MFIYQLCATWRHEIRRLAILKLHHFASGVCWCTVLLEGVKSQAIHICASKWLFWAFFVATMIKLQQLVIS